MQQWFKHEHLYSDSSIYHTSLERIPFLKTETELTLLKTFTVKAETRPGQKVCVSGNCPILGNWEINDAFVLTNMNLTYTENNQKFYIWSGKVHLPTDKEIFFRYFIAYILEPDGNYVRQKHTLIQSWESHQIPRPIQFIDGSSKSSNDSVSHCDIYGLREKQQISKGFLTSECAVQFKLYNKPIKFWAPKLMEHINLISIKMTPVPLSKVSDDYEDKSSVTNLSIDNSNSLTAEDIQQNLGWPFVECMDIPGGYKLQLQKQFGTMITENGFHLFQTRIHNFGYIGYVFNIYVHNESSQKPPYYIGSTYILPSNMKYSNGVIMCPITSVRQQPLGELEIHYLIIKPTKDIHCNLEKIKITDWKSSQVTLDIGHRGLGSSFKQLLPDCSHIRENTIASLKEAANKGADFVEFDIQLTKDLVPIIYHDFEVSLATKSKTDVLAEDVEIIQVPLKDFSLEQLHKLKIYQIKEPLFLSENYLLNDVRNDYQPFPKLEKAFRDVDINVGFNVELKWSMELLDGTFELDNPFDMNLFVDIILKTTFENAGLRSIVYSCFHPDVCIMLKMKQNRYPVLFLTQGVTVRYPPYADPRCHTIQTAVYHSSCHDLLGVNVHSEDLLRDQTQINMVKEAGLKLFCWGDENNCKEVVYKLKLLGVNAVIYDRLEKNELLKTKLSCAIQKLEIFTTENYCDQNRIILSKNQSLKEDPHLRDNDDRIQLSNSIADGNLFDYNSNQEEFLQYLRKYQDIQKHTSLDNLRKFISNINSSLKRLKTIKATSLKVLPISNTSTSLAIPCLIEKTMPIVSFNKFTPDSHAIDKCSMNRSFCTQIDNYPREDLLRIFKSFKFRLATKICSTDPMSEMYDFEHRNPKMSTFLQPMCESQAKVIYPEAGVVKNNKWRFIVQDQNAIKQGIRVETCLNDGGPSKFSDSLPMGYKTTCVQKYIYKKLMAITEGEDIYYDTFKLPSCCACMYSFDENLLL
ncbi:Carbohydrate-binding-like fold,Spaetzle,PLC-like phosphodiesterase, TIM beta/alpha-barrel [Cinara cedri]|uniref:Carbohydrate-binding-like fold,Spaetzle,PLC-like phosphodiesterase, TIM beta/alpha-barrel n=1 Tax=Cinara cedri TaxID=506608 RepID=A0A5E4N2Z1_9HEMI|nr:Carbohydrate-binding-like fold,Spaetzle,PLC-like phosphodiesterase, TIM beta/alpha-barrel [Cinara cedri]